MCVSSHLLYDLYICTCKVEHATVELIYRQQPNVQPPDRRIQMSTVQ
jgi:hypothetical protein